MGKSFFEKRSVFSIRKLAVGACSVLIGVSFLGHEMGTYRVQRCIPQPSARSWFAMLY